MTTTQPSVLLRTAAVAILLAGALGLAPADRATAARTTKQARIDSSARDAPDATKKKRRNTAANSQVSPSSAPSTGRKTKRSGNAARATPSVADSATKPLSTKTASSEVKQNLDDSVFDFDGMTLEQAIAKVPIGEVRGAGTATTNGVTRDGEMWFIVQRDKRDVYYHLGDQKEVANTDGNYNGYRVLLKAQITQKYYGFGLGKSAPLAGNREDAFGVSEWKLFKNSSFSGSSKVPSKNTETATPTQANRRSSNPKARANQGAAKNTASQHVHQQRGWRRPARLLRPALRHLSIQER